MPLNLFVRETPKYVNNQPEYSVYGNDIYLSAELRNFKMDSPYLQEYLYSDIFVNLFSDIFNPSENTYKFIENLVIKNGLWTNNIWDSVIFENETIVPDDLKYIFDVYQTDSYVGSLLDILEYRYGRYNYSWFNYPWIKFVGGREIKNLGRYIVEPNPKASARATLNLSNILQAHDLPRSGNVSFEDRIQASINTLPVVSPVIFDDSNSVKWRAEYGYQYNPGLTFSDTIYATEDIGIETETGLTGNLALLFDYEHRLKKGDTIVIEMNTLSLNPNYNGFANVIATPSPYIILTDKLFGQSSMNEGGTITKLVRTTDSVSGWSNTNYGSRETYRGEVIDEDAWRGNGFASGMRIENFSVNGAIQKNPSKYKTNQLGQMKFGGDSIIKQNVAINNDASGALVNSWYFSNRRLDIPFGATCGCLDKNRFFLNNWLDSKMGRQPLYFYQNPDGTYRFPNYTLGILNHSNYWPAIDFSANDIVSSQSEDDLPMRDDAGDLVGAIKDAFNCTSNCNDAGNPAGAVSYIKDDWKNLSTPHFYNRIEVSLLDSQGNQKSFYDWSLNNSYNVQVDYRKVELLALNQYIWEQITVGSVQTAENGDIVKVKLYRKNYSSNSVANDRNKIIDFNGFDWDYQFGTYSYDERARFKTCPYPFHMQWTTNTYPTDPTSWIVMKGPYGSNQIGSGNDWNWNIEDYNFAPGRAYYINGLTASYLTFSTPYFNYPVNTISNTFSYYRGSWFSRLQGSISADAPLDYYRIYMSRLNDSQYLENSTQIDNLIEGFPCFPAGEYQLDFIVHDYTAPDVISIRWGIGNEVVELNWTNTGTDYIWTATLNTNGGNMFFEALADPGPITFDIEPLRIRLNSDYTIAEKEFQLIKDCSNPYVWGDAEWNQGDKITMIWLNRLGSYERFDFTLDTKRTLNIDRKNYTKSKKIDLDGFASISDGLNSMYSQQVEELFTVNSNWLSETQIEWLDEMITSPKVFIEINRDNFMPAGTGEYRFAWLPVILDDTQYTYKTLLRDKLFNLQVQFRLADNINTTI